MKLFGNGVVNDKFAGLRQAEQISESVQADFTKTRLWMEAEGVDGDELMPGTILESSDEPEPTNEEEAKAAEEVNTEVPMEVTTEEVMEPQTSEGLETEELSTEGEADIQEMAEQISTEVVQAISSDITAPLTETPVVITPDVEGESHEVTTEAETDASKEVEVETGADVDGSGAGDTAGEVVQSGEESVATGDIKVEINL